MAAPNLHRGPVVRMVCDCADGPDGPERDRTARLTMNAAGREMLVAKNVPWAQAIEITARLEETLALALRSQHPHPRPQTQNFT